MAFELCIFSEGNLKKIIQIQETISEFMEYEEEIIADYCCGT